MPSIRITRFAGLLPQVNPKALPNDHAQVAHNCLLWDGYLRPMPQWQVDQSLGVLGNPLSLYKFTPNANGYDYDLYFIDAFQNLGEPFDSNYPIGISGRTLFAGLLGTYTGSLGGLCYLGVPIPNLFGVTQDITNNNQSVYPISRTYACTLISGKQEGPPIILPQLPYGARNVNGVAYVSGNLLYEGDTVTINLGLDLGQIEQYNITGIQFYRTVPGFDTAEQLGNPVETGFHFIGGNYFSSSTGPPGGIVTFIDSQDSSQIQGDLLISDEWMPPPNALNKASLFFGQTESGWAVNARLGGTGGSPHAPMVVELSERYIQHAWPPQNKVILPEYITGMAIFYDDIFIGTKSVPYHIHPSLAEGDALNLSVKPFINNYACIQNTMVATNFGAMYVAKDGLIALTSDGETVASRRVANPGDLILAEGILPNNFPFHFYDARQTGWWDGNFFGFTPSTGFIYNQPNPSNNEFPLGQLVTIDIPSGTVGPNIATGTGFYSAWGNTIYKFALPGYGYDSAPKATYVWKSKRYTMPGITAFAGMKIVGTQATDGAIQVTLSGYNNGGETSPSVTYSRSVNHSRPFRLPHQFTCSEFEIEVSGIATIQEIHVATSYRDLVESPGEG